MTGRGFEALGRRCAIWALALCLPAAGAANAAPPVRTMYNDALAREQTVRADLADEDVSDVVAGQARAVIARYEALVARYPASSYSDNALWQAGRLALDLFAKFSEARDKETATRLLRRLASSYPASKFVEQVPEQLARLDEKASPRTEVRAPDPQSDIRPADVRQADARQADVRPRDSRVATIKSIKRSVLPDAVRVVIELDGEVEFRQDRIPNPSRVFLDLPGTRAAASLTDQTIRFQGDGDIVRQVRIGRHPNNTTRVVLDADGVSSYSIYPMYEPYRLVVDCVRSDVAATTGAAPAPAVVAPRAKTSAASSTPRRNASTLDAHPPTTVWLRTAPANGSQHGVLLAEAHASEPEPLIGAAPVPSRSVAPTASKSAPAAPAPGTPAARNGNGGFSISRQLGLNVSRIVIDAGHGGHDPGAQARGVVEAELTLDVALRVEKLLQKTPGVEVILTRRTDEFIALQERTALANREGADLFLSIHANASRSSEARGVETYFLNFASNLNAAAVAARENAASGQAMGALPDIVKAIALNNKLDESRDFAAQVQRAMLNHLRGSNKTIKDLGVKQAPFVVLIGAAMPSVLAEISFVTNPQEARLLKSPAYRDRIAEALVDAIRRYQTSLKGLTAVASQQ